METRNPRRSPSPAHPMQSGYQLDDAPYGHSHLDMPSAGPGRFSPGDSLQMQTAVSISGNGGMLRAED